MWLVYLQEYFGHNKESLKISNLQITKLFAVTSADIQKALAPTKKSTATLEKLPQKHTKYIDLFKKRSYR